MAMRLAILFVCALALASEVALAESKGPAGASTLSAKELDAFMQTYYRAPDVEGGLDRLLRTDLGAEDKPESAHLLGVFFSHLLRERPDLADGLVEQLVRSRSDALSVQRARIASVAIANAELANGGTLLNQLAEDFDLDMDRMDRLGLTELFGFLGFMPHGPHGMDICWVSFFATGDARYVWKVADFLDPAFRPSEDPSGKIAKIETLSVQIGGGDEVRASVTGMTATWGLAANAKRHAAVREALFDYASRHPGAVGDAARKIAEDTARQ